MGNRVLALLLVLTTSAAFAQTAPARSVAITIDDMPAVVAAYKPKRELKETRAINEGLLAAFKRHHVPATGLVNEATVEEDGLTKENAEILELWLKDGMTLGNHTFSHPSFSDLTLEQFEKNTIDGERTIAPLLAKYGQKLRFFRYPFNNTGGTHEKKVAFEKFLAGRGYEIATCTIENMDWAYNTIYEDALDRHDHKRAGTVRKDYLHFTAQAIDGYTKMARDAFGREIPHVMLMHANRLNQDSMDDVLKIFEQRGFHFVSLAEAQSDPAYRTPDEFEKSYGWMWQQRWAITKHVKVDPRDAPDPPKWVLDEYDRLSKAAK